MSLENAPIGLCTGCLDASHWSMLQTKQANTVMEITKYRLALQQLLAEFHVVALGVVTVKGERILSVNLQTLGSQLG
jgi:hypothetical protein